MNCAMFFSKFARKYVQKRQVNIALPGMPTSQSRMVHMMSLGLACAPVNIPESLVVQGVAWFYLYGSPGIQTTTLITSVMSFFSSLGH